MSRKAIHNVNYLMSRTMVMKQFDALIIYSHTTTMSCRSGTKRLDRQVNLPTIEDTRKPTVTDVMLLAWKNPGCKTT